MRSTARSSLDGTVTGNAASLQTSGTLAGSTLAYGRTSRRSILKSASTPSPCPSSTSSTRRVKATTDATFVEIAGTELNQVDGDDHLREEAAGVRDPRSRSGHASSTRRGQRHLPSRPPGDSPAAARHSNRGHRVDERARRRTGDAVPARTQVDAERHQARERRSDARRRAARLPLDGGAADRQRSRCTRRNVDLAQVERLLLQNRGLQRPADRRRNDRRHDQRRRSSTDTSRSRDGGVPGLQVRVAGRRRRLLRRREIALDATLQQAPGVAITAKGIVPDQLLRADAEASTSRRPPRTRSICGSRRRR